MSDVIGRGVILVEGDEDDLCAHARAVRPRPPRLRRIDIVQPVPAPEDRVVDPEVGQALDGAIGRRDHTDG